MLKEIVESILNEGTQAIITVLEKGKYKSSILQYDGNVNSAGKELLKNYNSPKLAGKLVQKSGEIRDIFNLEFYNDKNILKKFNNEQDAINYMKGYTYKYFYDGEEWYGNTKNATTLSDFTLLKDLK